MTSFKDENLPDIVVFNGKYHHQYEAMVAFL